MKKFLGFVLTTIAMAAIMVIAVEANKLVNHKKQVKFEEERVARVEETTAVTEDLKSTITEISQMTVDEIAAFIEENAYVEEVVEVVSEAIGLEDEDSAGGSAETIADVSEEVETIEVVDPWADNFLTEAIEVVLEELDEDPEASVDEESEENPDEIPDDDPEGREHRGIEAESKEPSATDEKDTKINVTDDQDAKATATDDTDAKATATDDKDARATASQDKDEASDDKSDDDWKAGDKTKNVSRVADLGLEAVNKLREAGATQSPDESASASPHPSLSPEVMSHLVGHEDENGNQVTLEDRQKLRTSEEETQLWIEADEEVIETSTIDFTGKKIACIGDSVTEAANLLEDPDYEKYPYPVHLKEILGCEDVVNLGIGGSSLGRYWADAFCDRYQKIPEDTDIIIVFGGYNDGYCLHEDMVGSMDNRDPNTLYGGINDLFKGLSEDYPNAEVFVMTPLPNLLHDVLRKEREELLPQTVVVNAMVELADEYNFNVIDAYNQNFMDTHDANIVSQYVADSVHPGPEGYEVLAKHVAAEMIRIEEVKEAEREALEESDSNDSELSDDNAKPSDEHDSDAAGSDKDKKKSGIAAFFDGFRKNNDEATEGDASDDSVGNDSDNASDDASGENTTEETGENPEESPEPSPSPVKKVGITVIDRNNPEDAKVIDLD